MKCLERFRVCDIIPRLLAGEFEGSIAQVFLEESEFGRWNAERWLALIPR